VFPSDLTGKRTLRCFDFPFHPLFLVGLGSGTAGTVQYTSTQPAGTVVGGTRAECGRRRRMKEKKREGKGRRRDRTNHDREMPLPLWRILKKKAEFSDRMGMSGTEVLAAGKGEDMDGS
jgi:hypothetical protein